MAIEVIGKDPACYKQSTCKKCASILRYVASDIEERKVSCMGDIDTFYFVECPNCGNDVPASR